MYRHGEADATCEQRFKSHGLKSGVIFGSSEMISFVPNSSSNLNLCAVVLLARKVGVAALGLDLL